MLLKSKQTRTQITDLPETAAELAPEELQTMAGGATSLTSSSSFGTSYSSLGKTQYITYSVACFAGGDWDTDW
jgi:hypothetical protein